MIFGDIFVSSLANTVFVNLYATGAIAEVFMEFNNWFCYLQM